MPHTQSHYTDMIGTHGYNVMLGELYADCTGVASGAVNVGNYSGVNLMFNGTFGCCAWGGGGVTWEPPWGWGNLAVMGHEMGHAFGLPHLGQCRRGRRHVRQPVGRHERRSGLRAQRRDLRARRQAHDLVSTRIRWAGFPLHAGRWCQPPVSTDSTSTTWPWPTRQTSISSRC